MVRNFFALKPVFQCINEVSADRDNEVRHSAGFLIQAHSDLHYRLHLNVTRSLDLLRVIVLDAVDELRVIALLIPDLFLAVNAKHTAHDRRLRDRENIVLRTNFPGNFSCL